MPDWEQLLKERLAGLKLAPAVQEEVIAEFAGHLEDAYEGFLRQGIGVEEAANRAWSEFSNGRKLARRIQRAKQGEDEMNTRFLRFWLPALVTSLIGTGLLAFMEEVLGIRPIILRVASEGSMTIYLPWLLTLPVFGFVGAYWSRHAGGATGASILAGIFPALIYLALPFPLWPLALVVDPRTPTMAVVGLFWCLLNWAVLPCLALLVGALPVALFPQKSFGASQAAIRQ